MDVDRSLRSAVEPGTILGNYRIERLLGRGGMGVVYLAYDTTLHRQVALKVIVNSGSDAPSDRLLREARNAAALNHPNICTIHEVSAGPDRPFIAMEFVNGQPLSDRLGKAPIPIEEAIRYGIQAADALEHAHARSVVHRDFKAANVIVNAEGRVKVVDFGLARRTDNAAGVATTIASIVQPGVAAGTPYAMAPEQVRGETADARTDVWGLGVLLYEMIAGRRPFQAANVPELFSSILRDQPAVLPDSVPFALRTVIERCLEKDPARRYQLATEVRDALGAVQADAGTAGLSWQYARRGRGWLVAAAVLLLAGLLAVGSNIAGVRERLAGRSDAAITLAVLPFQNLTGDPDQEYFSDGLTDEMITQLGRLHPQRLKVIARTSSMRYKRGDVPLDQIARELSVDYVMEGSARREGTRVRISATLIQVSDQTQRWSDSFERELSNILSVQSDIAGGVARALAITLLPSEQTRLTSARPVNPEAYEAYLKGRFHWQMLAPKELDQAMSYFELAAQKDPDYAAPYVGMGTVFGLRCQNGVMPCRDALTKWKDVVVRAKELDPDLPQVQSQLAALAFYVDWDWPAAEREFRRAIELDATDPDIHMWYADYLVHVPGRFEQAVAEARRAVDLDPQNSLYQVRLGVTLLNAHREDESIAVLKQVAKTDPNMRPAQINLVNTLAAKQMYKEALVEMAENNPGNPAIVEAQKRPDAKAAFQAVSRIRPDTMVKQSQTTYVSPGGIAGAYARAGEVALALDWLEKAFDEHETMMVTLKGARTWDDLRGEPRFQEMLRRMNLLN